MQKTTRFERASKTLLTFINDESFPVFSFLKTVHFFAGIVSGALTHRYGSRPVSIIGFLLIGIGLSLSSLADSVLVLYLTYGVVTGIYVYCYSI